MAAPLLLAATAMNADQQQRQPLPLFGRHSIQTALDQWKSSLPPLPQLPDLQQFLPVPFRVTPGAGGNLRDDGFVPSERVLELTGDGEEWRLAATKSGVRVWRRAVKGSPFDEVRGNGLIRVPPSVVLALVKIADEDVVRQYNPLYDRGYDIQTLDATTKISYASARAIFPFKPRDTVTRVAFRELPPAVGGGTAVFQRAVKHPDMPKKSGVVRAEILRGMFLIQPVAKQPGVTNFTFTQQLNCGGIVPAWLMNQLIAQDGVALVQRLSATATRMHKSGGQIKAKS